MTTMYLLRKTTESAILFICVAIVFVLELRLQGDNQLPKYLRHCAVFWLQWPIDDLLLVIPLHPLLKFLALQDHAQNLKKNNFEWKGGGRSVLYLTDLWLAAIWSKKGRVFVGVS